MHESKSIGRIAWDCFTDLGITVVYATIVGLLIVGVVATDDGSGSLRQSVLWASLLPAAVIALIGVDLALRVRRETHTDRRSSRRSRPPAQETLARLQRS